MFATDLAATVGESLKKIYFLLMQFQGVKAPETIGTLHGVSDGFCQDFHTAVQASLKEDDSQNDEIEFVRVA